ncbi:MAG TPA: septation protein IspZ [Burkholderiaceae bacterium]
MNQAVELTLALCALLVVSWRWRPRQGVEAGVAVLLVCYACLGGWALWFGLYAPPGQEPAGLVPWKPTLMYWLLASILLVAPALGLGYPIKAILGTSLTFSSREWRWINLGAAALFVVLGGITLITAFTSSQGEWDGIKFACMVNLMFVFLFRLYFVWVEILGKMVVDLYGRVKALLP